MKDKPGSVRENIFVCYCVSYKSQLLGSKMNNLWPVERFQLKSITPKNGVFALNGRVTVSIIWIVDLAKLSVLVGMMESNLTLVGSILWISSRLIPLAV